MIWNISDFQFQNFELPVDEKIAHFRFEGGSGSRKYNIAQGQLPKVSSKSLHSCPSNESGTHKMNAI